MNFRARIRPVSQKQTGKVGPLAVGTWRPSLCLFMWLGLAVPVGAADPDVLRPRVPFDQIEDARSLRNPLPASEEMIEKGRGVFHGKGFCASCHGRDGKGMGQIPGLVGRLPRDFTDRSWQAARTDGELMWILKNGSPGTDMAPFIPLV